jgi:hypothetical protein
VQLSAPSPKEIQTEILHGIAVNVSATGAGSNIATEDRRFLRCGGSLRRDLRCGTRPWELAFYNCQGRPTTNVGGTDKKKTRRRKESDMRTTAKWIAALGVLGAAALTVPTSASAQGVYFGVPGFGFSFGAPYYEPYNGYYPYYGSYGYRPYYRWHHYRHWRHY